MGGEGPQRVGVALSGGGTRAALYSAGALLALTEGSINGVVEVRSMRSVSGSSLLLSRLILANGDVPSGATDEDRLGTIRNEIGDIITYGFAHRTRGMFLRLIALGAAVGSLSWWLLSIEGDGGSSTPLWWWVTFNVVVGGLILVWLQRSERILLRRSHRRRRRQLRHRDGGKWYAADHRGDIHLLPTTDVAFLSCCLLTREVELLRPWDGTFAANKVSLATIARASSAVPIYSAAVRIGDRYYGDGGAIDNLGVKGFPDNDGGMDKVVIVDASVFTVTPRVAQTGWIWGPIVLLCGSLGLVLCAALAWALSRQLEKSRWFNLVVLVLMLGMLMWGLITLLARGVFAAWTALRIETSITRAMQWHSNLANLRELVNRGHSPHFIRLDKALSFNTVERRKNHDLKTRLSPVRRRTAVELVKSSYLQTTLELEIPPNVRTLEWLSSITPADPNRFCRRCRALRRELRGFVRACVFGQFNRS